MKKSTKPQNKKSSRTETESVKRLKNEELVNLIMQRAEENSKLTSEELDEKYKQLGCYPKMKPRT